jgi:hypothetical protein
MTPLLRCFNVGTPRGIWGNILPVQRDADVKAGKSPVRKLLYLPARGADKLATIVHWSIYRHNDQTLFASPDIYACEL